MAGNIQQAVNLIQEAEDSFPVDRWVVNGMHVWPVVRFQMYFALRNLIIFGHASSRETRASKLWRLLKKAGPNYFHYLAARLLDRRNTAVPKEKVNVLLMGDQVSRVKIDGSWYDRFCDPIVDAFLQRGMTCFQLDPKHEYRIPRYHPSMYIRPALESAWLRQRLRPKYMLNKVDISGLEDVLQFLRLKVPDGVTPTIDQILRGIFMIEIFSRCFSRILECLRPSITFIVEYDNEKGMALNLACRRAGILTVEIPHGYHGELNIGYGRWNKVPERGYELLPAVFWCWSEKEASSIRDWCWPMAPWHRVLIGGNPWLNRWLHGNDEMVLRYDRIVDDLKQRDPGSVHILVTYEEGMSRIFNLISESPATWRWWLRIHPGRLHERTKMQVMLKELRLPNVDIDHATFLPLYALLRHMDIHLTEYSSVVIEAESFGVPSIMSYADADMTFSAQISSGMAVKALSDAEIIRAIHSLSGHCRFGGKKSMTKNVPIDVVIDQLLAWSIQREN